MAYGLGVCTVRIILHKMREEMPVIKELRAHSGVGAVVECVGIEGGLVVFTAIVHHLPIVLCGPFVCVLSGVVLSAVVGLCSY
jgi:hypothetical protein